MIVEDLQRMTRRTDIRLNLLRPFDTYWAYAGLSERWL